MRKIATALALIAPALALLLPADPAHAQASKRTFVSAAGNDSNASLNPPCPVTAPCRTFQGAYAQTLSNGEINALDPAGYGTLTITHGITIQGHGWASVTAQSGDAITINSVTGGNVSLYGLLLDGAQAGTNGIVVNSSPFLFVVDNCVINNFVGNGIKIATNGGGGFSVSNTVIASIFSNSGILVKPTGSQFLQGTIFKVLVKGAGGIRVDGSSLTGAAVTVTVADSEISHNNIGILSQSTAGGGPTSVFVRNSVIAFNGSGALVDTATLRLEHSVITGNSNEGIRGVAPTSVFSYGNNAIDGNAIDLSGVVLTSATPR